jgi:hypothetical protein
MHELGLAVDFTLAPRSSSRPSPFCFGTEKWWAVGHGQQFGGGHRADLGDDGIAEPGERADGRFARIGLAAPGGGEKHGRFPSGSGEGTGLDCELVGATQEWLVRGADHRLGLGPRDCAMAEASDARRSAGGSRRRRRRRVREGQLGGGVTMRRTASTRLAR